MHDIPPSSESSSIHLPGPSQNRETLEILKSLKEEGESINKADPCYATADQVMRYISGDQRTGSAPSDLHHVVINQVKKAIRTHVSALTDMRPLFAWKSFNPNYTAQSNLLNQLTLIWWVNGNNDLVLADAIRYALAAGAGDVSVEYDPFFMGGETRLQARDPRDTLPIRPERTGNIQDWEGLTLRDVHSVDRLRARFPGKYPFIQEDSGRLGGIFTRFKRLFINESTEPQGALAHLARKEPKRGKFPEAILYRTFLKDRSYNLSDYPIIVGEAGTNWCYEVPPRKPIYPNGRLIVWTELGILFDGPNPYWHGLFPLSRLRLDPWPWLFVGLGLAHDLLPVQDLINDTANDIAQNFKQHTQRATIWDRSVPESVMLRYDPRKPNFKIRKPNAVSDGMKPVEVPPLPNYTYNFLDRMFNKFDELAETANLQAMMRLRQMPGSETIEKYMEALTPGIRLEARQIEVFLRDVATMYKGNIFQFQSTAKRLMMLGEQGTQLQDLDYDPGNLVPAMDPLEPNYIPELDKTIPREIRARFFMGQFAFYVAPNSILALHAQERKLLYLQLARMGYLDIWTLMEMLEIPNIGNPPIVPLPDPNWKMPSQEEMMQGVPVQPAMVPRMPTTITERLFAQQQLGIGAQANAAGRKASGQAPPSLEQKGDGRPVMSESR